MSDKKYSAVPSRIALFTFLAIFVLACVPRSTDLSFAVCRQKMLAILIRVFRHFLQIRSAYYPSSRRVALMLQRFLKLKPLVIPSAEISRLSDN